MSTQKIIKELCMTKGISVSALEQELGFSNSSLKGTGAIKSDRLLEVAKYFDVTMEYLMGETEPEEYYLNKDAAEFADFLKNNPQHKVLFDASRKVKPEDMEKALKAIGIFIDE